MKKLLPILSALFIACLCIGFSACSDDDDGDDSQSTSDLIGSVWYGVNHNTGYPTEVKIEDSRNCVITVYRPDSEEIYQQERVEYLYSETTGAFTVEFDDWNVKGYIKGNEMTLTDNRYGSFTLKRVK